MKSAETSYRPQDIEQHLLPSRIIPQTFKIHVFQPMRRADGSERFAVVYATDADDLFEGLATIGNMLQLLGETPRFVLVGIGYQNPRAAGVLRMRDLLTRSVQERLRAGTRQVAESPIVDGVDDVDEILNTTDARDFLQFIREELMPFVAARYPVIPDDNAYSGYSAGGAFGLYTLFTKPDTFKRYIVGSPATSYEGYNFGVEMAQEFIKSGAAVDARVFMSVGELEEFKRGHAQFDLVTGYYLLAKFLNRTKIPGLDLTTRLFPGETHATAWSLAFTHGLRTLFGPVDQVPFWPQFMK